MQGLRAHILPPQGRLLSVGFEGDLPYTIALLDYGEYKVFGRLSKDLTDDDIEVGMELKTVTNPLPNGQINYIFNKA